MPTCLYSHCECQMHTHTPNTFSDALTLVTLYVGMLTETSKEFLCVCLLGKVIQFFSPAFTLLFTSVLSQPFPRFPSLSPPLFVSSLLSFSHPLITPLNLSSLLSPSPPSYHGSIQSLISNPLRRITIRVDGTH